MGDRGVSIDELRQPLGACRLQIRSGTAGEHRSDATAIRSIRNRDAGFVHQSVSLSDHADRIARSYERGDTRAARYLLQRSLDDCVGCHSKLPTAHSFPLGQQLLADLELSSLSVRERARVQVVARQFDAALVSYEEAFARPDAMAPMRVTHQDWVAYLKICLTIENDAPRALRTLERAKARGDLPPQLARDLGHWMRAIRDLESDPHPDEPLARARALMRAEEALDLERPSRGGLVHQIEAWHELQRFVAAQEAPSAALSEAYYLLGVVESRMLRPFGSAAASPYLEAAIRVAPDRPWARDAYALLEELTVLDYTGSGGTRVPPEVRERLDALERKIGGPR